VLGEPEQFSKLMTGSIIAEKVSIIPTAKIVTRL
jgi:hypothetical protein